MENVTIRRAELKDAKKIIFFQAQCMVAMGETRVCLPESGVMRILQSQDTDSPLGIYLVVVDEHYTPFGCCLLQLQFSDWRNGNYLLLESVYIEHSHRGRGVFEKLFNYVESYAMSIHAVEIRANVLPFNNNMHRALAKTGMVQNGYQIFSKKVPVQNIEDEMNKAEFHNLVMQGNPRTQFSIFKALGNSKTKE
jgi:GNAT superfamily N-acetyltransferase